MNRSSFIAIQKYDSDFKFKKIKHWIQSEDPEFNPEFIPNFET